MMNRLLVAFVVVLSFTVGFALKCNTCTSTTSLADCDKSKKTVTCAKGQDRCFTLTLDFKVLKVVTKSFIRGCNSKAYCDAAKATTKACDAAKGKCKLECCQKDLCNGGMTPVVSVLLVVTCALVAFFR